MLGKLIDQIFELPLGWMFLVIVTILFIFVIFLWIISGALTNMFWGALPWDGEGARRNIKTKIVNPFMKNDKD